MFSLDANHTWCLTEDMLPVLSLHPFMEKHCYSQRIRAPYAGQGSLGVGKALDRALEAFFTEHKEPSSPLVRRMVEMFQEEEFATIEFQVPVFHAAPRVGTYLDAVATDKEGNTIIIENKTGYDNAYGAKGKFTFQNTKVKDTIQNRHCLQAALGAVMYARQHKIDMDKIKAMVFLINTSSFQCGGKFHVPSSILQYATQLLSSKT